MNEPQRSWVFYSFVIPVSDLEVVIRTEKGNNQTPDPRVDGGLKNSVHLRRRQRNGVYEKNKVSMNVKR